jgi:hypothetical protein
VFALLRRHLDSEPNFQRQYTKKWAVDRAEELFTQDFRRDTSIFKRAVEFVRAERQNRALGSHSENIREKFASDGTTPEYERVLAEFIDRTRSKSKEPTFSTWDRRLKSFREIDLECKIIRD